MHFGKLFSRVLISVLLISLLVGCGSNTSTLPSKPTQQVQTASPPLSASTPSSTPEVDIVKAKPAISFTTNHLFIHSITSLQCRYQYHPPFPLDIDIRPGLPRGSLVLTNPKQLTYDSGTIRQMRKYATEFYKENLPLPSLPRSLEWLSASPQCDLQMDVTNNGTTPIQIQTADIQLSSTPRPNLKHYNLVDICSLEEGLYCPPQGAGGRAVIYNFQLKGGKANTILSPTSFSSPDISTDSGPSSTAIPFVLNRGDTVSIMMIFTSTTNTIYPIIPRLTLATDNGPLTVKLSRLAGTIFIANDDLFSCYKLQGNTFVPEQLPSKGDQECI